MARGLAWARVWKRPDVDAAEGARFAERLLGEFSRLHAEPPSRLVGAVLDLREAPAVTGPVTREILGRIAGGFHKTDRRFAFLTSGNPTQRLQLMGVASSYAAAHAMVCSTEEECEIWVRRGTLPPPSSRR